MIPLAFAVIDRVEAEHAQSALLALAEAEPGAAAGAASLSPRQVLCRGGEESSRGIGGLREEEEEAEEAGASPVGSGLDDAVLEEGVWTKECGPRRDGVHSERGQDGRRQTSSGNKYKEMDDTFVLLRKGVALGVAYSGMYIPVACVLLCGSRAIRSSLIAHLLSIPLVVVAREDAGHDGLAHGPRGIE